MNHNFSIECFEKIKEFIYRKTGISIEFNTSYEKLENHINNFKDYFFKLRFDDEDGAEFQKLVNLITNNDTYFYREKEQFEVFVKYILPQLDEALPKTEPIRILSAPCSSGEEVYSILIHLLEEGSIIKNRSVEILGVDIDSEMIEKANKAVYSDKSTHFLPQDILSKYFIRDKDSYKVKDELTKYAQFKIVNLFDKNQVMELGKFNVIFSRNMFVHFDEISRKEVAISFYEMLSENGFVLLGDAEHMSRIVSVFNTSKTDGVFIHKK